MKTTTLKLGYNSITEYIKFVISTRPLSSPIADQAGVDLPYNKDGILAKDISLSEKGIATDIIDTSVVGRDWTTDNIGLRITRSVDGAQTGPERNTKLSGIVIESHPLIAKASLSSSAHITKSADGIRAPHAANFNSALAPIDLAGGKTKGDHPMDVLELEGVENKSSVTINNPLKIRIDNEEDDNETIVPMGFDTDTGLYFPVGYFENGKVMIDSLPSQTPNDSAITQKSLTGSIKIYFQKVIGQRLGFNYNYPRLRMPELEGDKVNYDNYDGAAIKAKVTAANSVAVFIHGIIGDTEGMVKTAEKIFDECGSFRKNFDVVLTFDYENLGTPIEQNAVLLGQELGKVGLKPGHGKELVLIAHSMGGLVARSFIEDNDGHKVVSKLFMLGTPNNGSEWSDVRDLAESLLTMAINGAAFLKPWTLAISLFGKLGKGTQSSLKQMQKKSPFIENLNRKKADPKVPYTIIAGNTQMIDPQLNEMASKISRLFDLVKKKGVYLALDAVVFKKPNDIAVTVTSIEEVPPSKDWSQQPRVTSVASDHLNYFNNETAMKLVLKDGQ
ncbi:MAG: hypothetical protein WDO15_06200 [Bacteroidota bacterium]